MKTTSRRQFLVATLSGAAATLAAPTALGTVSELTKPEVIPAKVFGANDRVRIAVFGVNGRGVSHIETLMKIPEVSLVALCDPDMEVLKKRASEFETKYQQKIALEQDFRKLYDRKDIDAVTLATPNHWHTLQAIWACQAGKDVYVEKPATHNVFEGRKLIEAAYK